MKTLRKSMLAGAAVGLALNARQFDTAEQKCLNDLAAEAKARQAKQKRGPRRIDATAGSAVYNAVGDVERAIGRGVRWLKANAGKPFRDAPGHIQEKLLLAKSALDRQTAAVRA